MIGQGYDDSRLEAGVRLGYVIGPSIEQLSVEMLPITTVTVSLLVLFNRKNLVEG